jgi:plasmid rolling circle replication initiator protein Rep
MSASKTTEGEGSWYLSDVSPADKPWDIHRTECDEIKKLCEFIGYARYAERINECSQWLEYALKATDEGAINLKLRDARFCRVRHCPICQWRRSLMWRARLFKALPKIREKYPTGRWVFLTLTVRNCEISELRATLTKMNAAWGRLVKRKTFPALGFIKSLEVTRGVDGTAHPHFHCLLFVPAGYFSSQKYITQAAWATLWQSCLKSNYTPVIDVRAVKPKKDSSNATLEASNQAIFEAVCETLKYSVKPSHLLADAQWLDELIKQLQNTRSISIGGCLKEFFSEDDPENFINGDIEEEEEKIEDESSITFKWSREDKRYKKTNTKKIKYE